MMGKKENEKTTKERREKPGGTFLNAKALKRGGHTQGIELGTSWLC